MEILMLIAIVLFLGWILGLGFRIAGGFIHILLILALVLFIIRLLAR